MELHFEFKDVSPFIVNIMVGRPRWRGTVMPFSTEGTTGLSLGEALEVA